MRLILLILILAAGPGSFARAQGWREALPGWEYRFPQDHGNHPEFRTEWWYFTGNAAEAGDPAKSFGFELVFFRHGILPPGTGQEATSRFVMRDLKFAHFAVSDFSAKKFHHAQVAREVRGPRRENPDELVANLLGERIQVLVRELLQVSWRLDLRQQLAHDSPRSRRTAMREQAELMHETRPADAWPFA